MNGHGNEPSLADIALSSSRNNLDAIRIMRDLIENLSIGVRPNERRTKKVSDERNTKPRSDGR